MLKSRSCVCDAGADGSGRWIFCFGMPQINQRMGNTEGVSTVLEHTAVRNASGEGRDFPLVNRSRMVSLSQAD